MKEEPLTCCRRSARVKALPDRRVVDVLGALLRSPSMLSNQSAQANHAQTHIIPRRSCCTLTHAHTEVIVLQSRTHLHACAHARYRYI